MVFRHEVAFKLTEETIDFLIQYQKQIYLVDQSVNTSSWPDKDAQIEELENKFVRAIHRFIFKTNVYALEGLEGDGTGELLERRSEMVKTSILGLFLPLLPPPPRILTDINSNLICPKRLRQLYPVPAFHVDTVSTGHNPGTSYNATPEEESGAEAMVTWEREPADVSFITHKSVHEPRFLRTQAAAISHAQYLRQLTRQPAGIQRAEALGRDSNPLGHIWK